jgi:hypothetical protein
MPDSVTETQHGQAHIPPWWESELPEVTRELRAYLQRKLPTLHDHHEDILTIHSLPWWSSSNAALMPSRRRGLRPSP